MELFLTGWCGMPQCGVLLHIARMRRGWRGSADCGRIARMKPGWPTSIGLHMSAGCGRILPRHGWNAGVRRRIWPMSIGWR